MFMGTYPIFRNNDIELEFTGRICLHSFYFSS